MPVETPSTHTATKTTGRIRQKNEEAILLAAAEEFAVHGYKGTSMNSIAQAVGLPKANLHYYFGAKQDLYRAVLAQTLQDWLAPTDVITPDADPQTAIEAYIRAKMALSITRPHASRVFANELLHGAPVIGELLRGELRATVVEKAAVIDGWIEAGKMAPVDSTHLFFTLWAATQTYADFDAQVCAVLGVARLGPDDLQRATDHVLRTVLRGCGVTTPRHPRACEDPPQETRSDA